MSEWRYRTVGELCDEGLLQLQTGPFGSQLHAHDYVSEGVPVVPTEALRNRQIDPSVLIRITHEKAKELGRHRIEPGDILFARRGVQATGHIGYVREKERGYLCGTGAIRLRVTKAGLQPMLPEFLSHVFANPAAVAWFKFHAIGATMPNLNEGIIRTFPLQIPPPDEQKAIADLLSALDDKIELNRAMNETLEAAAYVIFKSWFIDFSPVGIGDEGWCNGNLSQLADTVVGGDWGKEGSDNLVSEQVLCIRGADIEDLQSGGLGKMPRRFLRVSSLATRRLREQDLVVEISGGSPTQSTGRPVLITSHLLSRHSVPLVCSNFCRLVRLKDKAMALYVYRWLRHLYASDEFLQYENGTTGIKNLAFTTFAERHLLPIPPHEKICQFNDIVEPMLAKQQLNGTQNETLAGLRDLLLPKLLSGAIRVRQSEKIVEEHA